MNETLLTKEDSALLNEWKQAFVDELDARAALTNKANALKRAVKRLGNAIVPPNVTKGEKVIVPINGSFLQITCHVNWCDVDNVPELYTIEWRNES